MADRLTNNGSGTLAFDLSNKRRGALETGFWSKSDIRNSTAVIPLYPDLNEIW